MKNSENLIFFNGPSLGRKREMTDDRRRRKNLVHSFCQKSWISKRLRVFEKHRKFDFFQRSLPWTKKGNDGRPATATTEVGDGDDRRRRRPMTTTTTDDDENDDRRRRKNLVHSFCQKSWILERLRVFEKHRKFDFFQRSLPWTKKGNDGRPTTATTDVGDDRRRRRPTTTKTTTDDGEKISCTHFAKNLEF